MQDQAHQKVDIAQQAAVQQVSLKQEELQHVSKPPVFRLFIPHMRQHQENAAL